MERSEGGEVNDIIERINAAIVRIAQGHAPMRIPADAHSDADIVLGDDPEGASP